METSDKKTIIKIKNGQIDYFALIVKKYTAVIYRYIKNKINTKEDTEDLVQNSFMKFYKSINRFDVEKPILPYLYEIAKNELKMFYRSRKPTVPLNENIYAVQNTETINIDKDNSYIKLLKAQEKQIFSLLSEGFKNEEIATKFKIPLNTVKSIIRRARIKIKKIYE